ncbi:MAG TPA: Sec-independent protein translocase protein TatB [Tepidiformaceae bacterium]
MEFLGVGYQELLVILVLLLVVVGPERLPNVAYQIGRAVRQAQRYARAVREEFSDEIGYLEEQYRTVKGEIDTTSESIRKSGSAFDSEMRSSFPKSAQIPPLMPQLPDAKSEAATPTPSTEGAASGATPPVDTPKTAEAAPPNPPLVF